MDVTGTMDQTISLALCLVWSLLCWTKRVEMAMPVQYCEYYYRPHPQSLLYFFAFSLPFFLFHSLSSLLLLESPLFSFLVSLAPITVLSVILCLIPLCSLTHSLSLRNKTTFIVPLFQRPSVDSKLLPFLIRVHTLTVSCDFLLLSKLA